ncbi:hypothetical protein MBLNU459_g8432t1 [Dothideomycetes sp. NU459]
MSVKLFTLLSLALTSVSATSYSLSEEYSGSSFWSNFDFYTGSDPTEGWVDYVSYDTAVSTGLIADPNVPTWGVDHTNVLDPSGTTLRPSIRMTSKATWTHGLFIADIAHMPDSTCGVWPAWWTFGQSGNWPASGEIDIIEFVNNANNDLISAHTADSCTISGVNQTGVLQTSDCALSSGGSTGCSNAGSGSKSVGTGFNENGGGVYAMEWTSSNIRVWFFPRGSIPSGVTAENPDTSTFGEPVANIAGNCDIDTHFWDHAMVFDTTFCGSWAGAVFQDDGCPMTSGQGSSSSCVNYVAENPSAFANSYWAINSIKIYQSGSTPAVASGASSSSTTAAASTSTSVALESSTSESVYSATSLATSYKGSVTSTTALPTTSTLQTSASPSSTPSTTSVASTTQHQWTRPTWGPRSWTA